MPTPHVSRQFEAKVGEIAMTWNGMHVAIFCLFAAVTRLKRAQAAAIFYALKADSAQRDITRAAAVARLSTRKGAAAQQLSQRITSLFDDIGRYAGIRNGIVHGALVFDQFGYGAVDPFNPPSVTSPKHRLFGHLDREATRIDELAERTVAIFNETAEFLKLPPKFLV
ncbi:MAG TPA: hypothetical protein VH331_17685 [Allosphingosinicella sp.]|jgi:hypothetical protein|nr:hypothetical protein [Allosphingosinicella sp.]